MYRIFFLIPIILLIPTNLVSQQATEQQYEYDEANNLKSVTSSRGGEATTTDLPLDDSGRNRPSAIGSIRLSWDRNGNLIEKGDQGLRYDYRNRLTQVLDAAGNIAVVYGYDALNRRVVRKVGEDLFETIWSDWRPIETYCNGKLQERRTYGAGLDEVVRLEIDLDLDGTLDQTYVPIYDHSGNLALLTNESGKPIERYSYSPFGHQTIRVDSTAPAVDQVRTVGSDLWLSFSEEVLSSALEAAVERGSLRIEVAGESQPLTVLRAERDMPLLPRRRFLVSFDGEAPIVESPTTLIIEAGAAVDTFANVLEQDVVLEFAWPATGKVLLDVAPPRVEAVRVREGVIEIDFTEAVAIPSALEALTVDGVSSWRSEDDGVRFIGEQVLTEGPHTLTISGGLVDLASTPLASAFTRTIAVDPTLPLQLVYIEPDPRIITASAVRNTYGFHGHQVDPETGFIYMRNRYYDPDMGRFISADPMGYFDGPNPYQFAGNSPYNYGDPLGLYIVGSVHELHILKQVLLKAGAADLARLLRLERRSVPERFRGGAKNSTEERIAIIDQSRDWTKHHNEIARLIAIAIASDVRVEFSLSGTNLKDKGGAMTKSRGLFDVPYFDPDRPDDENHILIEMNPTQVLTTRVPSYDAKINQDVRIPVSIEAAVVHELGHAYWMFGLRKTAPTPYNKTGSNEEAVRWENIYRTLIDLPLRAWH